MFGPLILAKQAVGKLLEQAKTLGLRPPNIRTLRKASYISKGREGELFAGGVSLLLFARAFETNWPSWRKPTVLAAVRFHLRQRVHRQPRSESAALLREPSSVLGPGITLGQIYKAVETENGVFVMRSQVHKGCMVVCAMERRLGPIFNAAKDAVGQALSKTSLAELVRGVSYICQQQ